MTFSLAKSKNFIDLDESVIIEIYRSTGPTTPPDPMYDGHPCEAYLCTGREKGLLLAYVAVLDTVTRTPFIFTATCDGKDLDACRLLVAEANDFIAAMGFALEKVTIDYGAAMRQVIIRNLRIMRPPDRGRRVPPPTKQVPVAKQEVESVDKETAVAPRHAPKPPSPQAAIPPRQATIPLESPVRSALQGPDLSAELASLKEAVERLTEGKSRAEAMARQAVSELTAQVEQARSASREAERSGEEEREHYRQLVDSRSREIDRLKAELALVAEARQTVEESLEREIALHGESEVRAAEVIARLETELEEGGVRQAALEERLLAADADLRKSESALEAAAKLQGEDEAAAKKRERQLRKELAALREEAGAPKTRLKDLEDQCRALVAERDAARDELSEMAAAVRLEQTSDREALAEEMRQLKEANQVLAARLDEIQRGHDQVLREKEMEQHTANEMVALLTADAERLSSEKRASELGLSAFKKKVRDAVERLKEENRELEQEVRRLREQADAPPTPMPLPVAEADAGSPRPAAGPGAGRVPDRVCTAFKSGDTVFRYNQELSTITCHSGEEVIEVHGSMNAIQAGPFGRTPQVCRAYIIALKRGRTRMINLAWFLADAHEVLVCTPEKQPDTAAGYAGMMRDAIFYFESTGFMMDRLDMSKRGQRQFKSLEESGICSFDTPRAPVASVG